MFDQPRAADANEWSELDLLLLGSNDKAFEHLAKPRDRRLALDALFIAVPPQRELPHLGLFECFGFLQVELNDPGADVGAADIHGKYGVEGVKHPAWRQVHRANQA